MTLVEGVLAAHADFSLPAQNVIDALEAVALEPGLLQQIRVDNGGSAHAA